MTPTQRWMQKPENRAKAAEAKKRWSKNNQDKVRAYREKWKSKNPGLAEKLVKEWKMAHPEASRLYRAKRRAAIKKARTERIYKHKITGKLKFVAFVILLSKAIITSTT